MSITLDHVTRVNGVSTAVPHIVLNDVSFAFPPGKTLGVLGQRGTGKTTLIRLLAGAIKPTNGRVRRAGLVSHPVASLGWLNRFMTGRENACFLARLHGFDPKPIVRFIEEASGLGQNLDMPLSTYSGEKRARFGFSLSYAMPFDTFVADEVLIGGPPGFRETCRAIVRARQETSSFILATRSAAMVRTFCSAAAILHKGELRMCNSVMEAVDEFANLDDPVNEPAQPGEGDAIDDWVIGANGVEH